MIFKSKIRTDLSPKNELISHFSYLDQSGRTEAEFIRNTINQWIELYPMPERINMINRLQSKNDPTFLPAFFELYIYILLLKLGAEIGIEPEITGKNTRPDFYFKFQLEQYAYLEASCLFQENSHYMNDKVIGHIIDRVNNKLSGGDKSLSIKWNKALKNKDFSSKDMAELVKWYNNPTKPNILFSYGNCTLEFEIIDEVNAKNSSQPIIQSIIPSEIRKINTSRRLYNDLKAKSQKYGILNKPFFIAVNLFDNLLDDNYEIFDALFGTSAVEFNSQKQEYRNTRLPDGFWREKPNIWSRARINAVIIAKNITPWCLIEKIENQVQIFYHPSPAHPLSTPLDQLPNYKLIEKNYKLNNGEAAYRIINDNVN